MRAIETGDRYRVKVLSVASLTICLALIMTMKPDTGFATVRAAIWTVRFRVHFKVLEVLLQGAHSWPDAGHRLVSVVVIRFVAYHDIKG